MFTGIVQGRAKVMNIEELVDLKRFLIQFPKGALTKIQQGASVALNGVCLTVTKFDTSTSEAYFDVMNESLRVTNLGALSLGSSVNFERAAQIGAEIGGHLMSGHISITCPLVKRIDTDTNCELVFGTPESFSKYILPKGFVGLDGCSLTVGSEVTDCFSVHLIPETLAVTGFSEAKVGDEINVEIDPQTQAIVDTVERYLEKSR